MTWITIILCCVCISAIILSCYYSKKFINQWDQLKKIYAEIQCKQRAIEDLDAQCRNCEDHLVELRFTVDGLATRKQELNKDIANQVENIERLKSSYETTEDEFKKKYMAERKIWLDERQDEYLRMQEDFVNQFKEDNSKKLDAARELSDKLDQLRSEANAAVEVAKRNAEQENFVEFHSLQMEARALNDIKRLEDLVPSISPEAGEAIAKVIWKVYYEKPYTDLVGRVVGSGRHTGIYRITNTQSKMCYVGQAVDIADRWRQHIKRAINAEPRTNNKLYPAMYKEGLENFTFEIIEECDQSKLNAQEDYWQEFYKAKEYGYSIK